MDVTAAENVKRMSADIDRLTSLRIAFKRIDALLSRNGLKEEDFEEILEKIEEDMRKNVREVPR